MKIAILMATYNGEKFIREQIDSIIAQTYSDWILYINDDGSTDNTITIVEEYAKRFPKQIIIMKNETEMHGPASNFFELMQKVPKADWYALCDQDDVWYDDRLEKMLKKAMEYQNCSEIPFIVFGQAEVVDEKLNVITDSLADCIGIDFSKFANSPELGIHTFFNAIHGCTLLYNNILHKKLLNKLSLELVHDMSFLRGHDSWLTEVCAWFGKIVYVDQKIIKYRQHSKSVTGEGKRLWKSALYKVLNTRQLLDKIRAYRIRMIKKIELFEEIFSDELSEKQKTMIIDLRESICCKNRVCSLWKSWQKRYWGRKGMNPYNIVLFLFRKEPE